MVPHRDYFSFLGVFFCFWIYLGLKLTGSLLMAMPAAISLFALFILPVCLYLTFTRMIPFAAFLCTVAFLATALAPHQLRFDSGDFTYSTIYDRWGYCLFLAAFMAATICPLKAARWKDLLDGVIAGTFIVISIFLKISYGLLLLATCLGFAVIVLRRPIYYASAAVSGLLWLLAAGWMLKWNFGVFIHDMSILAHARSGGVGAGPFLHAVAFFLPDLCVFLMLGILAFVAEVASAGRPDARYLFRIACIAAAFAFCAIAIIISNAPLGTFRESPILSIGSLVLLSEIIVRCRRNGETLGEASSKCSALKWIALGPALLLLLALAYGFIILRGKFHQHGLDLLSLIVLLLAPLFVAPAVGARGSRLLVPPAYGYLLVALLAGAVMTRNIAGLLIALRRKESGISLPADEVFQSGGLKGLQILGFGGDPPLPGTYVNKVRDGLDLISRTGNAGRPVLSLDFSNPFNEAEFIRPPAGSPTVWHFKYLFSDTAAPAEEQAFDGAEVVMVPKQFGTGDQESFETLYRHYGDYLSQHYRQAGETGEWVLLERK